MSDTAFETPGVLDLTGADTSTFEAIPAGKYKAIIWDVVWDKTKNPDGTKKMPDGTPMLKVQVRLDNEEHADQEYELDGIVTKIGKNRTLFGQFVVPPPGYDPDAAAKMKGSIVNFLIAIGYDEKKVKSASFKIVPDDMKQKECCIIVNRYKYPKNDPNGTWQNGITGFKPVSAYGSGTQSAGALL